LKNIWVITWSTLREAMARKVFLFFLGISAVVIIVLALITILTNTSSILGNVGNFSRGNKIEVSGIGGVVTMFEILIINSIANLGLLLAIFSSASFVPVMLEKGNIDLLLSKPISRAQLLWGKYTGGILVVLINISFLIVGVWFIISLKFSYWNFAVLWSILLITFAYAALNAVIVLFGVITKSSILGMMTAYFIYLILSPFLLAAKDRMLPFLENKVLNTILDGFYYIIPKTSEIFGKDIFNLASGTNIEIQPVISSFLFLLFIMILSVEIFKRKDF
jgi:ABC-type transport system involved in multi-copper enzyme maturation permease subunit